MKIITDNPDWPFIPSPGILRREDFGHLLNLRGLHGTGVEIGTHLGVFAEAILANWRCKALHCVDPWMKDCPGYLEHFNNINSRDRDADFATCQKRLSTFGDRVQYHRMMSHEAAPLFEDGSLDFVYVDGNHLYEYVKQDIALWWPKVKPMGVFAGHDLNGDFYPGNVDRAVREFMEEAGIPVFYMLGDSASWYCVKEG